MNEQSVANKIRNDGVGTEFELCSIVNAKSGLCGEDCKFCAQSSRHNTDVSVYPLKDKNEIIEAARQAKKIGAKKFGIVASGNRLNKKELDTIARAISQIKSELEVDVCCSLGALEKGELLMLKEAGLCRYHHNIETSERFYPQIVSTHSFQERIDTIKAAKEVELEVCSGGIFGLGETRAERVELVTMSRQEASGN